MMKVDMLRKGLQQKELRIRLRLSNKLNDIITAGNRNLITNFVVHTVTLPTRITRFFIQNRVSFTFCLKQMINLGLLSIFVRKPSIGFYYIHMINM